ncbi:hypothetical protein MAE02_34770 [Microvirga aerophila]|uniref:Uncharacterized protein n=1 Tax=Microvirga aerophila TaxID=670291 RepID=A0A512BUX5_9HYPH|nr:hypothetical protein MAE02_34770 [Microvirga aerophila]
MTSSKRMAANKANAQRSTGPRTVAGKSHSRLNASKHRLAVPISDIPELAEDVAQLARRIVENLGADESVHEAAVRVAEAAIDVLRARAAGSDLLNQLSLWEPEPQPSVSEGADGEQSTKGGDGRTRLKRPSGTRKGHGQTQEPTADLSVLITQLEKLERYERRSHSRRDKAIKVFEELREAAANVGANNVD